MFFNCYELSVLLKIFIYLLLLSLLQIYLFVCLAQFLFTENRTKKFTFSGIFCLNDEKKWLNINRKYYRYALFAYFDYLSHCLSFIYFISNSLRFFVHNFKFETSLCNSSPLSEINCIYWAFGDSLICLLQFHSILLIVLSFCQFCGKSLQTRNNLMRIIFECIR